MAAFDVVVLGGGTAGVHVATEVAGGGKTVALVEAGLIGGESAYLACLPSNSLLLSASRGEPWEDAVARRAEVTGGLDDSAAAQRLNRAGVQVIRGTGRITAPGTVEVTRAQGAPATAGGTGSRTTTLTYSDLVIATGCEPVAPPIWVTRPENFRPPYASTFNVTGWQGRICASCVSLKFAVTHRSVSGTMVIRSCPAATFAPSCTFFLFTMPAVGATIFVYERFSFAWSTRACACCTSARAAAARDCSTRICPGAFCTDCWDCASA